MWPPHWTRKKLHPGRPLAPVEDTQSPAQQGGTRAPCGPDGGHSDWEGEAEERSGGGELLCTYFGVIISLNLREQVSVSKRHRQEGSAACEGQFRVVRGVEIGCIVTASWSPPYPCGK